MKHVESAPKLELSKSLQMFEDAQRLTPGGVGGIRRPYNFVIGEYPIPVAGCGARAIIAIPDGRLFFSAHDAGAIGEVIPRR